MLIDTIMDYCDKEYKNYQASGCNSCTYGKHCPNDCSRCLHYIHTPSKAPQKRDYNCKCMLITMFVNIPANILLN